MGKDTEKEEKIEKIKIVIASLLNPGMGLTGKDIKKGYREKEGQNINIVLEEV